MCRAIARRICISSCGSLMLHNILQMHRSHDFSRQFSSCEASQAHIALCPLPSNSHVLDLWLFNPPRLHLQKLVQFYHTHPIIQTTSQPSSIPSSNPNISTSIKITFSKSTISIPVLRAKRYRFFIVEAICCRTASSVCDCIIAEPSNLSTTGEEALEDEAWGRSVEG